MMKYDDIVATANELLSAIKSKDKSRIARRGKRKKRNR